MPFYPHGDCHLVHAGASRKHHNWPYDNGTNQPLRQCGYFLINEVAYTFNTATTFNTSASALTWSPINYTINFAYTKANTNYHCGSSVAQINYHILADGYMDYYIDCVSKLLTGVQMAVYATTANKISLLVINTLTI